MQSKPLSLRRTRICGKYSCAPGKSLPCTSITLIDKSSRLQRLRPLPRMSCSHTSRSYSSKKTGPTDLICTGTLSHISSRTAKSPNRNHRQQQLLNHLLLHQVKVKALNRQLRRCQKSCLLTRLSSSIAVLITSKRQWVSLSTTTNSPMPQPTSAFDQLDRRVNKKEYEDEEFLRIEDGQHIF